MNKAIFLDRDGIINLERKDYVKTIKEFILINGIFVKHGIFIVFGLKK
jgi:histidinol phosphatase-like enzyme